MELFFGSVRSALGSNNNPSCQEFEKIFKRLFLKLDIKDAKGNCERQDGTSLLTIPSTSMPLVHQSSKSMSVNIPLKDDFFDEPLLVSKINLFSCISPCLQET